MARTFPFPPSKRYPRPDLPSPVSMLPLRLHQSSAPRLDSTSARRVREPATPATGLRERRAVERALAPQYEVHRLLARGGMGAVYLAEERALRRRVAIKVLDPAFAESSTWRERFRAEARVMAGLAHPGVIPVHAYGEHEGVLWYVMPFVRGESLGARLRREGTLNADDARRILADIADALDYVHRRGVVHRDVKPDNILLEQETGRAVLVDFGIAADPIVHERSTDHAAVGTPWYMSPEQVAADAVLDGRSDVYALGVLGYLALSGRLPFEGATFEEIAAQHLGREPVPLRKLAPHAPRNVAAAVTRCLAKDPAARWPDAGAFARAIAAARISRRDQALGALRAAARRIAAAAALLFAW